MGEVIELGRRTFPVALADGPLEEIRCCGSVGAFRVIVARQPEAYPGSVLAVLDGRPAHPAEGLATALDNPGGHRLIDYVGLAVLRTLLFIASDGDHPNNPVAPAETERCR